MPGIQLINNYIHPLSTTTILNGEKCADMWMVASIMAAVATQRIKQGSREKVITSLAQMGMKIEDNFNARLDAAKRTDSEYLKILSEIKELLDQMTTVAKND